MSDILKYVIRPAAIEILCFVVALLVPMTLLLDSATRSISPAYPYQAYQRLPADELGLTQSERLDLAVLTLAYLQHPEPAATAVRFLASHRLPGTDKPLYSERELAHLVDVKQYTDRLSRWRDTLVNLLVLSLPTLLLWPAARQPAFKALRRVAMGNCFLLCGGLLLILAFWPLFFYGFHVWLFPPGSWGFTGSDTLLRLFPEPFWAGYAQQLVTEHFILSALLLLAILSIRVKPAAALPEPIGKERPEAEDAPSSIEHIIYHADMSAFGQPGDLPYPNGRTPFAGWPVEEE